MSGTAIRQDYLETVIEWISRGEIEDYMAQASAQAQCQRLWLYFQAVIDWVKATFPNYRKEMKGVEWGTLYNVHGKKELDPAALERTISRLMADEDVTSKKGIYSYVLDGNERYFKHPIVLPEPETRSLRAPEGRLSRL